MDKKTVTAVLLILLVIMTYQLLILPKVNPPRQTTTEGITEKVAPEQATPLSPPPVIPQVVDKSIQNDSHLLLSEGAERQEIAVNKPLYSAVLDNLGGGFQSWRLEDFAYNEKTYKKKTAEDFAYYDGTEVRKASEIGGESVELLLPVIGSGALGITFTDTPSKNTLTVPLSVEETDDGIILRGADQYGLVLLRRYRFNPDNYDVEMDIIMENRSDSPRTISWEISLGPDIDRYRLKSTQDKPEAIAYAAGEVDTVKVKGPDKESLEAVSQKNLEDATWVGIRDRYFLAALSSTEGSLTGFVRKYAGGRQIVGMQSGAVTLVPGQPLSYKLISYLGPKDQKLLASMGVGFEKSVNYGWFSWLALPFLTILKFFFRYLHNWGLAILALTLLVKLSLFPITQTMYRSMRKMQSLQPQIQALKKKFKDDSQALQRETMALYREYKVNPMAGCLPMVIQIPVFFALYRVLFNAIELRGASFLYIPDLSQKDPFYITPLLMGATMILQQRMSPTSVDPKQARMMMFMPIIFTAMFLNFSSGLVLYFLFSNVFAIGEQYLVRKWTSRAGSEVIPVQDASKQKGGKKKKR